MRKLMMFITVLFASAFVLIGCSDNDNNGNDNSDNKANIDNNDVKNNEQNAENNDDNNNDNNEDDTNDNLDEDTDIETEDQEDLKMGDTGKVETTIGTFEMTLDDAELVGPELDGVETFEDDLMLLDITIKNVGDDVLNIEDVLEGVEVTDMLEGSGNKDGAEDFDSVDKFTGTLEPGEEESGQFITDVTTAGEYYVRQDPGSAGAGGTNQVIWIFDADEAE